MTTARLSDQATVFRAKESETSAKTIDVALGLDFDTMPQSQLDMWFDVLHPVGSVYFSIKGEKNPSEMDWPFKGMGVWTLIASDNNKACLGLASDSAGTAGGNFTGTGKASPIGKDNIESFPLTVNFGAHNHAPGGDAKTFWVSTQPSGMDSELADEVKNGEWKYPRIKKKYSNYGRPHTGDVTLKKDFAIGTEGATGPDIDPYRFLVYAWYRVS